MLEKLASDQILEPVAGIFDRRPIPKIELLLLFDRSDPRPADSLSTCFFKCPPCLGA